MKHLKPQYPVIPDRNVDQVRDKNDAVILEAITYAEDQPPYLPLPTLQGKDQHCRVTTRWRLDMVDRLRVLFVGDLYLQVLTFNFPLQPVKLFTKRPGVDDCL